MDKRWSEHIAFLDRARAQHGVFSIDEWLGSGFTRGQLRTLLERGLIQRVFYRVYALRQLPRSPRFWIRAGCLRAAPLAAGFAGTAAGEWDLLPQRLPVHVATRRNVVQADEVRFHRVALPEEHTVQKDGICITGIERTLLDSCAYLQPKSSWRLVRRAVRRRNATKESLGNFTEEEARQGRDGVMVMRAHLERLSSGLEEANSDFEDDVYECLVAAGFPPPERNHLIDSGRGFPWEVDLIWRSIKLVIECDHSGTHGEDMFHRDREKRLDLEALGYIVVSVTEEMFRNRSYFLARLRQIYEEAARRSNTA